MHTNPTHTHTNKHNMATHSHSFSITALQITDPDAFRDKVRAKLTERFTKMQMNQDAAANAALNLERGIYNYTLSESDAKNIVKKWDNGYFVQIYADRLRAVCINMGNDHVIHLITSKQIKARTGVHDASRHESRQMERTHQGEAAARQAQTRNQSGGVHRQLHVPELQVPVHEMHVLPTANAFSR